jgi:hypothetical protein
MTPVTLYAGFGTCPVEIREIWYVVMALEEAFA